MSITSMEVYDDEAFPYPLKYWVMVKFRKKKVLCKLITISHLKSRTVQWRSTL